MGLTRLVALPAADVTETYGCLPPPGTRFVMAGQEYESVALSDDATVVYAVPVT